MIRLGQEILQENENMSEAHTADLGTRYRYRREGAELERERIIKLLERYQGCQDDELCAYTCSCFRSDRFIELIKGEQK
jgi:hypothetical protein